MYEVTSPTNSGRVIAVWSPVSRQGGVSTLASLLASYICRTYSDERVLVLSNETNGQPTAEQYITKDKAVSGLAEVIELAISDNLHSPEDLYNNAHNITSNLDALTCDKGNTNVADFLSREVEDILELARKSYKFTIVDTVSGQYDTTTQEILKSSDCIVVGLPQDKYIFDNWVRKMPDVYPHYLKMERLVLVASCYFDYSHMRYQDMRKEFKGFPLYYVNQNSAVHKAVSYRNMLDFVSEEMKVKKGHDEVIDEIGAIFDRVETILVNIVNQEIEDESREAERKERENKEYIEEHVSFYSDIMYGEGDNEEGLPDMEEDFGVYGGIEETISSQTDVQDTGEIDSQDSPGYIGSSINLEKKEEESDGFDDMDPDNLYGGT